MLKPNRKILAARKKWRYRGQERPDFAHEPAPRQRSVWDFPRPPVIEFVAEDVRAGIGNLELAFTKRAMRVLETAGAPTYYIPPEDLLVELVPGRSQSICEWKGLAQSLDIYLPDRGTTLSNIGWRYTEVFDEFLALASWVSFYPARVECSVGDERVTPQPGGYYGGWVTSDLAGPIKGEPGSEGW